MPPARGKLPARLTGSCPAALSSSSQSPLRDLVTGEWAESSAFVRRSYDSIEATPADSGTPPACLRRVLRGDAWSGGKLMSVETGSGTLAGLLARLSATDGEVFIRAAVRTGSHAVWHVDAVVAPPAEPPGWQPQAWEYDEVTFIAGQASSRALAAALDPGDAQVLSLGGYDLTFPVLHEQVPWQHKPSRAR